MLVSFQDTLHWLVLETEALWFSSKAIKLWRTYWPLPIVFYYFKGYLSSTYFNLRHWSWPILFYTCSLQFQLHFTITKHSQMYQDNTTNYTCPYTVHRFWYLNLNLVKHFKSSMKDLVISYCNVLQVIRVAITGCNYRPSDWNYLLLGLCHKWSHDAIRSYQKLPNFQISDEMTVFEYVFTP